MGKGNNTILDYFVEMDPFEYTEKKKTNWQVHGLWEQSCVHVYWSEFCFGISGNYDLSYRF